MPLPTTNLTLHVKADINADVWKFFQTGSPYHNTPGVDGDNIEVWDDADGKPLTFIYPTLSANGPTYRATTPVMLLPNLVFNGSNEWMALYDGAGTTQTQLSDIFGAGAKTFIAAIRVNAVVTNNATVYLNEAIFSDGGKNDSAGGGSFGLHLRNTGSAYKLQAYNWDGSINTVEADIYLNRTYIVTVRHDGTDLFMSLDDGVESSHSSANTSDMTGLVALARGYLTPDKHFNGSIGELACYNAALTGSDLTDAIDYFMNLWWTDPGPPPEPPPLPAHDLSKKQFVHSLISQRLNHLAFKYQQPTDPFLEVGNTVAAGDWWLNTTTNHLNYRNDANDGWVTL